MSVNPVSGGSELSVEQKKAQYREQRDEYCNIFATLVNDDRYKSYFAENGELKGLKEKLEDLLEELDHALDGIYDEAKIDKLMQALGALLAGSATLMGLEARILAYITLADLNAQDLVTEADYGDLLAALNSKAPLNESKFDKLLEIAQYRKSIGDFINKNKSRLGNACEDLESELSITIANLLQSDDNALKTYTTRILDLSSKLRDALFDMISLMDKTRRSSKAASLSMKVIQANNAYRDIESQLKADASIEDRAILNENMKRLRDEGIWVTTTSKRREEVLQEDALQKARAAEQNAERKNI